MENLRSIKIKVEVDTNKRTITKEFEPDNFEAAKQEVAEALKDIRDSLW